MELQDILHRYHHSFIQEHGHQISANQRSALNAMMGCRQGQYGEMVFQCEHCPNQHGIACSCGHRACNQCQYNSTELWLDRQKTKTTARHLFYGDLHPAQRAALLHKNIRNWCIPR